MKQWLKDNWLKVLSLIGVAFLIWVLFRGCKSNDNSALFRENDSLRVVIKTNNESYKQLQDSIAAKAKQDSIAKAKLSEGLKYTKKQLSEAVNETQYYISVANRLKKQLDTVGYVAYCDSLVIEVHSLIFSNHAIQQQYEEALLQLNNQIAYSDSVSLQKDILYYDLSRSSDLLLLNNYTLTQRLTKAEKGRKFNKTLTRVLAAAVLVLGGAALAK